MPYARFRLARYNLAIALHGNRAAFRLIVSTSSLLWVMLTIWAAATSLDSLTLVSPTQDFMAKVMPIYLWELAFLVQGIVGLTSLLLGVRNELVAIFDRLLGAIVWNATSAVLIVGYLYTGRHIPPIWAPHLIVSAIAFLLLVSAKHDE